MTATRTPCPSFGELADYWTSDITPDEAEQIETHVFDCERCARMLAEADRLRVGIRDLARSGNVQAFVNDAVLNRLARDGVRVRSYALDPGETVRCAVWADDDVIVARLRADFTGVESVDAEMRFDTGEEWAQATDVPVRKGETEMPTYLCWPSGVRKSISMRATMMDMSSSVAAAPRSTRKATRADSM